MMTLLSSLLLLLVGCSNVTGSAALSLWGPNLRASLPASHEGGAVYDLTVIMPAYNELLRIGDTLTSYTDYLSSSTPSSVGSFTVLVVDDGSTDGMVEWIENQAIEHIRCISLPLNQGKGAAVACGIASLTDETNQLVLVADADGSAAIQSIDDMIRVLVEISSASRDLAVIVGNRGSSSSSLRSILRWGFQTTVRVFAGDLGDVTDTQCGCKLYTLQAAKILYKDLNLKGWTHDVEVLYRAKRYGIPVSQVNIKWKDKEGSKLVSGLGGTIGMSIIMLLEVLQMRLSYQFGMWTLPVRAILK